MDPFEKYLREQEEELSQVEEPRREILWEGIQRGLQQPAPKNGWALQIGSYWRWSIAVSLAIIISLGIWFYPNHGEQVSEIADWAAFYPGLAEQENQFKQLVTDKEAQLNLEEVKKTEFRHIFEELELLEEVHQQMKADLPVTLSEEELVNILMKYYERKIRILERLSREIEKSKRHEEKQRNQLI